MIIEKYISKLEEKWGMFKENKNYFEQLELDFISPVTRFNVLFKKVELIEVEQYFDKLNARIHPQLLELYKTNNGLRFFSNSLSIYGIHKYPNDVYEPYDLIGESRRYKRTKLTKDMLVFGCLGNNQLFTYDKYKPEKTFIIDQEKDEIIMEFEDVNQLFEKAFNVLLFKYDKNGKKNKPNLRYEGLKALENMTSDINERD